MTLWDYLNSDLIRLLLGFILTTLAGAIIANLFQKKSWQRQTRIDLYRKRYEEGTKFLDELSELVGKRYYLLQRFLWAVENGNTDKVEVASKEYFEIVKVWNSCYFKNRNKVRLLISDEMANYFLDYKDDNNPDKPKSLHYKFVLAHKKVIELQKGTLKKDEADKIIIELNWKCSAFLEHLTTDFSTRAEKLSLLDPSYLNEGERAALDK